MGKSSDKLGPQRAGRAWLGVLAHVPVPACMLKPDTCVRKSRSADAGSDTPQSAKI